MSYIYKPLTKESRFPRVAPLATRSMSFNSDINRLVFKYTGWESLADTLANMVMELDVAVKVSDECLNPAVSDSFIKMRVTVCGDWCWCPECGKELGRMLTANGGKCQLPTESTRCPHCNTELTSE